MTQKQEELIREAVDKKKEEIDELMELYYKLAWKRHEREEKEREKIKEGTKKREKV